MDIELQRDGITLRGKLERASNEKGPIAIIFHGFLADLGYTEDSLYSKIAERILKENISVIRFDFNGHGKSDGKLVDMDVLNELEDAMAILNYVRKLDFVTDIYVVGHSQGGVVGGMLAGYYPDIISKLALLAPAATLKDDALMGTVMGTKYDTDHIPETVSINNTPFTIGGKYFRIAKLLPIYEVTKNYKGNMLVIHGLKDQVVDVKAAYRYREAIHSCKLGIYEELDHGIAGEDSEKALNEMIEFLK